MRAMAFILMLIAAFPATAQRLLSESPTSGGMSLKMASVHLTLPAGDWRPLGEGAATAHVGSGGGFGTSGSTPWRAYLLTEDNKVSAFLTVSTNELPAINSWTIPGECARKNIAYNSSDVSGRKADCLTVNHIVMGDNPTNDTGKLLRAAAAPYGGLPRTMILVRYDVTTFLNFMNVTIYLNPELSGFPQPPRGSWGESPWHKVRATPDRFAYQQKVAAWAEGYRKFIREGVD